MAVGYSDLSNEVSATTGLAPPEWIDIDTTVGDEIILEFERMDNTDAGDITIYRSQSDGVLGSEIASLPYDATTYTDTTANVDEVNYYTLRRDTGSTTVDSIQANTLLPPPGITVTETKWDALLSWSDAATTEVGYRVYRQVNSSLTGGETDLAFSGDNYQSPGTLTTVTKTVSDSIVPDLEGLVYDRNGGTITVDVIGSPGEAGEESNSVVLDGDASYPIEWNTGHESFRLEITLTTSDSTQTPVFSEASLSGEILVADLPADSTEYQTERLTILDSDPDTWTYRVEAYRQDFSGETTTASEDTTFTLDGVEFAGEWTLIRPNASDSNGTPYIEDATYDIDPVVDTANPFGDYGVGKLDDRGGEKFEYYPRGERVEFWREDTRVPRLTGYVVERRETEQRGADALEIEAYSFDQFLRRNTVTNSQDGNTITEALQDIVETDTPVSWNASNIDVGDDQELTREYRGDKVENVLRDLAFKSNNEEFGVNDSLEFFFRPRESTHIDRGIDNTQWFNYDIPELGKQAINEVEVWFSDGNESVIVDDSTDKLDLQDSLDLTGPGTQRAELNRPLIQDISDAEDIGRKYLQYRNATLSGTVTTYSLYDAEPGDTIDITITPRGINSEFVIAASEYRWGRDQTIFTIIEKRGEQDGILTELNDSVQRVEMNGADRDAPKNRITSTNATAIVDVSVDADGNTPDGVRFVNNGRRAARDGWRDESYPAIQNIVTGDDPSGLSRSNTSLGNQTTSASVSENLPDTKSVEYSASITETGVEELGLETDDGTLITRATFDTPVDLAGTVTITLTVSNDDSVSRGVLTNDGQTAVRDVLADNTPAVPTDYAYGSDGSAVSESDTALANELYTTSLDELLVQSANTQSEWDTITDDPDTLPVGSASDDTYGALQVCWTREGENADALTESGDSTNTDFSNGDSAALTRGPGATGGPDFAEWDFTVNHTIPADEFVVQVRDGDNGDVDGAPAFEWTLVHDNGSTYDLDNLGIGVGLVFGWTTLDGSSYDGNGYTGPELTPGDYTLRVEVTDSGGQTQQYNYVIDVVAPYDARYESDLNFDDTVNQNDGYLDGPEKYASQVVASTSVGTRRNISEANYVSSWNDTSGNQYVELANDGSNFTRFNNADTGSVTFNQLEAGIDVNWSFGRYSDGSQSTPLDGNQGQRMSSWELFSNPDAVTTDDISQTLTRAIVPPNTPGVVGETVREAGLKNGSTLLTRHELAEFSVLADQRLASSETTAFNSDD